MTVKDLIKDLQQYPDDADITFKDLIGNFLTIGEYNLIKKPDMPNMEVLEIKIIGANASEPMTGDVDPEKDDDKIPM